MFIDTHCHLTSSRFSFDVNEVVANARAAQVDGCLVIGTGLDDGRAALALVSALRHASPLPRFGLTIGLEPSTTNESTDIARDLCQLEDFVTTNAVAGVGEFGFEFHHQVGPKEAQADLAREQCRIAVRCDLPVILHARSGHGEDAHHHMVRLLDDVPGVRGVIHSFDGNAAQARAYIERGFLIAVNGMATFRANHELRAAISTIPHDFLLLETDAPYLSPLPLRGQRNEPARVPLIAATVALAWNLPVETVGILTSANAQRLFPCFRFPSEAS